MESHMGHISRMQTHLNWITVWQLTCLALSIYLLAIKRSFLKIASIIRMPCNSIPPHFDGKPQWSLYNKEARTRCCSTTKKWNKEKIDSMLIISFDAAWRTKNSALTKDMEIVLCDQCYMSKWLSGLSCKYDLIQVAVVALLLSWSIL